jgi:long-chain acyl-CoA synthetase
MPEKRHLQSVKKPGSQAGEAESAVYVCGYSKEPLLRRPFPQEEPALHTLYDLFLRGCRVGGDAAPCLGYRDKKQSGKYNWLSFGQVREQVHALGDALLRELALKRGDRVGIYAKNCKEWMIVLLACSSWGLVPVPVYDSLGANSASFVIEHSEMKVLFTSVENLRRARESVGSLSVQLVVLDGDELSDSLATFRTLLEKGDASRDPPPSTAKDENQLMIIMYTSGTTGTPKGVMLKNEALLSEVAALKKATDAFEIPIGPGDMLLSYLPLAHIFAQASEALWLVCGASIAYYGGDIKHLVDDIIEVKPTVFIGVPRVFARFHERVMSTVAERGLLSRTIFRLAYAMQSANVRAGTRSRIWDRLIFEKLRERLFPRVRFFFSGAAPLPEHLNIFMHTVFCAPMLQGYGMTETTAGAFVGSPKDPPDCVGGVMACFEFKLVDVPEMKYTHRDKPCPRGELWLRGPALTCGYYKNEQATKEAFPRDDGWMATGDIGRLNPDGTLTIIDRKKNIFKLAQGEYVAVEALESEYHKAKGIGQIWVYGNSMKNSLVAVVVPDPGYLKRQGLLGESERLSSLRPATCDKIKQHLLKELAAQAKASNLKGYEYVKAIHLETDLNDLNQGFTIENDCLTPTMKLKRPQLIERYRKVIDQLYTQLGE